MGEPWREENRGYTVWDALQQGEEVVSIQLVHKDRLGKKEGRREG